jgi:hypothetical protein
VLLFAPAVSAQPADDGALKLAEPDFTLIALPTALRLPKFGSAFLVTHRFTRPLGSGDFGDLAADFFGMDTGAQIGLEYRFGIIPSGQIGVLRTSDRQIEFFAEYGIFRQRPGRWFEVMALASIEGGDNFKDAKSPALGAIVSRRVGDVAAFYVEPIWVNNSNPLPKEVVDHNDTFMIGLGARIRIRPTVYIVGEFTPRVSGYRPGSTARWRGHREARRRSHVPVELRGCLRDDDDTDRAGWSGRLELVLGLQHLAQVLLNVGRGSGSATLPRRCAIRSSISSLSRIRT